MEQSAAQVPYLTPFEAKLEDMHAARVRGDREAEEALRTDVEAHLALMEARWGRP